MRLRACGAAVFYSSLFPSQVLRCKNDMRCFFFFHARGFSRQEGVADAAKTSLSTSSLPRTLVFSGGKVPEHSVSCGAKREPAAPFAFILNRGQFATGPCVLSFEGPV